MDIKSFFHEWCRPKHRQRFLCEVRVASFSYVGAGNSTNKKDAEKNAAKDFVNFLVRNGNIQASEVPGDAGVGQDNFAPQNQGEQSSGGPPPLMSVRPNVFGNSGMGPQDLGQAYRRVNDDGGRDNFSFIDRAQQQLQMDEAESLDVNAAIHGNWTIENAKAKLHQFMQMNKINADYKYTPVGPDHARYVEHNSKLYYLGQ
uniref:DRBM domain-containing protein n=1 Tax=Megaselia scalaris TaxID=36166 RepID=T1GLX8_MEGSC